MNRIVFFFDVGQTIQDTDSISPTRYYTQVLSDRETVVNLKQSSVHRSEGKERYADIIIQSADHAQGLNRKLAYVIEQAGKQRASVSLERDKSFQDISNMIYFEQADRRVSGQPQYKRQWRDYHAAS